MNSTPIAAAIRRQMLVSSLAILAGGLVVPEPLAIAAPKGNRKKFTVVTRTFTNPAKITIPESGSATPYPAAIEVVGLRKGRLLDANLQLRGVTHKYTYDIDVLLVAPNGRNAVILSDASGDAPLTNQTLTLDDEGEARSPAAPLPNTPFQPINVDAGPQYPDVFTPPAPTPGGASALATFDGINPNGRWSLYIIDDASGEDGAVADGWALTVTAKIKNRKHRDRSRGRS